jgi:cation diffusion facilitator family transporter
MSSRATNSVRAGRTVTLVGVFVNTFLIALKLAAGLLGRSQALIADAIHSVSDLFTDAVVLLGLKLARKAPDEGHPFGHARIETLACAAVGMALLITALYLGVRSALDIYGHKEYHPTAFALVGAAFSIALKEGIYQYTVIVGRRIKSQLITANAWHHRSDALSSVAVFLGVAGARLKPEWHILDAYAALLVSFFIIKVALEILWKTLQEFTDRAPSPDVLNRIRDCSRRVDGVLEMHDLKVRTSGGRYQMETHIVVDGHLTVIDGHRIATTVEGCLKADMEELDQVIVHVDPAIEKKNGG